jgi:hypothetical protein
LRHLSLEGEKKSHNWMLVSLEEYNAVSCVDEEILTIKPRCRGDK